MSNPTDPLTQIRPPEVTEQPSAQLANDVRARIDAIEAGHGTWHFAQLNMGVFKLPLDAPEMAPFVNALDRINQIADESPGFVWRLKGDNGEPSSYVDVPGATDPMIASNLSVWTDYEAFRAFMYRTDHAAYMRRRAEWFERVLEPTVIGWWIPAGTIPTLAEALGRLEHFKAHGPSDTSFVLGRTIPDPPIRS